MAPDTTNEIIILLTSLVTFLTVVVNTLKTFQTATTVKQNQASLTTATEVAREGQQKLDDHMEVIRAGLIAAGQMAMNKGDPHAQGPVN